MASSRRKNTEKEREVFNACLNGDLKKVKRSQVDLKTLRDHQWYECSPLHHAARYGHLLVVRYLVHEVHYDPDVKDSGGWTPLHDACRHGHLPVVRCLLQEVQCDPDVKDSGDCTPLHWACRWGEASVVQFLLESGRASVNVKNKDGDTPLHTACQPLHRVYATDVVELLLTKGHSDPNCANNKGETPLALTDKPSVIRLLLKHGAKPTQVYQCSKFLPSNSQRPAAQPTITVFMIGNRGAGKTTLTKALITERKGLSRLTARLTKVEGVKERTAGIECHQIHSPRIGSLTIYDLAGHREFHSSHDTVIRSASSGAMFLFVVDLTATDKELQQTVFFWLASIQNQVPSSSSDSARIYLLLIGSHADQLPSTAEIRRRKSVIEHACKSVSNIHVVGFVAANCQHSESSSLTQVREHIFRIQETLQENMTVTFPLHCFHIYLITLCGDQPGVQLGSVIRHTEQEGRKESAPYFEFLPQDLPAVHEKCAELNRRGIILYLQKEDKKMPTEPVESSWVIIEKELLLKNVNGTVFAPQGFQEYKSLAIHTGVVPFSKVRDCFKEKQETKDIDTELIIQFMIHMEFCGEILDNRMLELLAIKYPDHKNDRHFLFPNLITENKETVERAISGQSVWQPNPHITYSTYSLCWVLQCHGEQHFFSPRFLQVLLLRLAFQHALPADPQKADHAIPGLKQACTLWQSGIKWNTTSLTEVLVEVSDHQVVVTMRCERGEEHALIRTRSQVIKEVLSVKNVYSSSTKTLERLIPNPTYPVNCEHFVPVPNVAYSISIHEPAAVASDNSATKLDSLLYCEPYMYLPSKCLQDLYSTDLQSQHLSQQFIECAARAIVKHYSFCKVFSDLCTVLDVLPHEISVDDSSSAYSKVKRMFLVWKQRTQGTYQSLRECLDIYSVFSGRCILDVAKVPLSHSVPEKSVRFGEKEMQTSVRAESSTVQSKLDSKPTIQELQTLHHHKGAIRIIRSTAPNWESLGVALGFDMPVIQSIRRATHYQPEDGCLEMLALWLKGEGATWNNLLQALDDIEKQTLASDLKKILQ